MGRMRVHRDGGPRLRVFAALMLAALMVLCSCFGTFHTARVVPFSGGLLAMTVDDQTVYGVSLDTGIPASSWPGIGLSANFFTRDYAPGLVLGARLQAPRNRVADAAVEYDLVAGGGVPGRFALLLSRRADRWEPYIALGVRPAWDDSDPEDDDWLDIWDWSDSDEASASLTLGCFYRLRSGFGPRLGAEFELGGGMVAPMAGLTLQYGF